MSKKTYFTVEFLSIFFSICTEKNNLYSFSITVQANQSFHNNQAIVTTVQNAKTIVDGHATQLTQLETKSTELVTRMDSAYTAATAGRDLEANTFTAATNMLDVMQNFRQKADSKP